MHRSLQRSLATAVARGTSTRTLTVAVPRARRDASTTNNINNLAFQMRQARAYGSSDALFSDDKTADSAAATDSDAGATNSASQEQENHEKDGDAAVVNETEEKIATLEAEVKSLKDQLLRGMAEEENVRRIAKKDVENARLYGIQSFAKTMLDVADNLERAIDAVPEGKKAELANQRKEGEDQGDAMLGSLLEGIIAVEKGLQKTFNSNGLYK